MFRFRTVGYVPFPENETRTLAHLGARCAGGGGVGWSVGLGLPESAVTVESCNSQNSAWDLSSLNYR